MDIQFFIKFFIFSILIKFGFHERIIDSDSYGVYIDQDIQNFNIENKFIFKVVPKVFNSSLKIIADNFTNVFYNRTTGIVICTFRYDRRDINWDKRIVVEGLNNKSIIIVKFKDKEKGIKIHCPTQYIVRSAVQQAFCTPYLAEEKETDMFRHRKYPITYTYFYGHKVQPAIYTDDIVEKNKFEYKIRVEMTIRRVADLISKTTEVKLILFGIPFSPFTNYNWSFPHRINIKKEKLVFILSSSEIYLDHFVIFTVNGLRLKFQNITITKQYSDFPSLPEYFDIKVTGYILIKLNSMPEKYQILNGVISFLLYETTDYFFPITHVFSTVALNCPTKSKINSKRIQIKMQFPKLYSSFVISNKTDLIVSNRWKEGSHAIVKCLALMAPSLTTVFKDPNHRILQVKDVKIIKKDIANCHFVPRSSKIILPDIILFACVCHASAKIVHIITFPVCKIVSHVGCQLSVDCQTFDKEILNIQISVGYDSSATFFNKTYKKASFPTVVFYHPRYPRLNTIITCMTDTENSILQFRWVCNHTDKYLEFMLVDFFKTQGQFMVFLNTAPVVNYSCICIVKIRNFKTGSAITIYQNFTMQLRETSLMFCNMKSIIRSSYSKSEIFLYIIVTTLLFMGFPLLAYIITEYQSINSVHVDHLYRLGIADNAETEEQNKIPSFCFSKHNLGEKQFDLFIHLVERCTKNEEKFRRLKASLDLLLEKNKMFQLAKLKYCFNHHEINEHGEQSELHPERILTKKSHMTFEEKKCSSTHFLERIFQMKSMSDHSKNEYHYAYRENRLKSNVEEIFNQVERNPRISNIESDFSKPLVDMYFNSPVKPRRSVTQIMNFKTPRLLSRTNFSAESLAALSLLKNEKKPIIRNLETEHSKSSEKKPIINNAEDDHSKSTQFLEKILQMKAMKDHSKSEYNLAYRENSAQSRPRIGHVDSDISRRLDLYFNPPRKYRRSATQVLDIKTSNLKSKTNFSIEPLDSSNFLKNEENLVVSNSDDEYLKSNFQYGTLFYPASNPELFPTKTRNENL